MIPRGWTSTWMTRMASLPWGMGGDGLGISSIRTMIAPSLHSGAIIVRMEDIPAHTPGQIQQAPSIEGNRVLFGAHGFSLSRKSLETPPITPPGSGSDQPHHENGGGSQRRRWQWRGGAIYLSDPEVFSREEMARWLLDTP